jgi:hypothetical protein
MGRLYNRRMPALPTFLEPPADVAGASDGRATRAPRHGIAIVVALSLLLVVQVLLADRVQLAADARWRPAVETACAVLRCQVPAWREPAAFTLVQRDVRPDPARPGALRVAASFRNDARWAQAWPLLVLTLSDADGRAVGFRAFTPSEYLGKAPAQATLASGASAVVALDVIEPGPGVVAFTFDFR